jgi:hypothetical protein
MTNVWDERRKALENEFFQRLEREKIEKMKETTREQLIRDVCLGRCPKCGEMIKPMTFRGVPLDKCPGCGGVWLGTKDIQLLAEKDHRTWFDKWFRGEEGEG